MKNFVAIIILFVAVASLTSCTSNRGHGCGYWSATEIPQQEERQYQFLPRPELTCIEEVTAE